MARYLTMGRAELVKKCFGPNARPTERRMEAAGREMALLGWKSALPPVGAWDEKLVLVHKGDAPAELLRDYCSGRTTFARARIEALVGASISTRTGAAELGRAGFAIIGCNAGTVWLRAADPREAVLVNSARCGPHECAARDVLEALLHLPEAPGRQRFGTRVRRACVERHLREAWDVEINWFMRGTEELARLRSGWTYGHDDDRDTAPRAPDPNCGQLTAVETEIEAARPALQRGRISQVIEEI